MPLHSRYPRSVPALAASISNYLAQFLRTGGGRGGGRRDMRVLLVLVFVSGEEGGGGKGGREKADPTDGTFRRDTRRDGAGSGHVLLCVGNGGGFRKMDRG